MRDCIFQLYNYDFNLVWCVNLCSLSLSEAVTSCHCRGITPRLHYVLRRSRNQCTLCRVARNKWKIHDACFTQIEKSDQEYHWSAAGELWLSGYQYYYQWRRSIWDVPPIFGLGDIITNVPLNISRVISTTFYPCNIFLISWKSF